MKKWEIYTEHNFSIHHRKTRWRRERSWQRFIRRCGEKGYNPINQIVGYIMSGDPTYITSYNSARSLITKLDRDEILEELVQVYIESKLKG